MNTTHPISAESLLRHDDFVRGLARSLLGRDARAEDVAQDAWVAAAQGGPRSEDTAKGYDTEAVEVDIRTDQVSTVSLFLRDKSER